MTSHKGLVNDDVILCQEYRSVTVCAQEHEEARQPEEASESTTGSVLEHEDARQPEEASDSTTGSVQEHEEARQPEEASESTTGSVQKHEDARQPEEALASIIYLHGSTTGSDGNSVGCMLYG